MRDWDDQSSGGARLPWYASSRATVLICRAARRRGTAGTPCPGTRLLAFALVPVCAVCAHAGDFADRVVSYIPAPGQFVNIELPGRFLRRPISVCDYDGHTITLIYKVIGEGTAQMAGMAAGGELDMLTGLGNGFSTAVKTERPLLVGGGVGVPPLYNLAKRLLAEGRRVSVVLGFNTASEVFYAEEF